jgi:hypothetical protein
MSQRDIPHIVRQSRERKRNLQPRSRGFPAGLLDRRF